MARSNKAEENTDSIRNRVIRIGVGAYPGMPRLHLFEFGDQQWFPQVLRDAETAYLAVAYRLFPLARPWAERISTVLEPGEPAEIVDLCSGSGGPMPLII